MAIGQNMMARERIIVSAAERLARQVVPLSLIAFALVLIANSELGVGYNLGFPAVAFLVTGIAAAGAQFQVALVLPHHPLRRLTLAFDLLSIATTFVLVRFGSEIVVGFFGVETVAYRAFPGPEVNTAGALITSCFVAFFALLPMRRTGNTLRGTGE